MSRAPILHQETRLSPSPASPSQVLYINTSPEQRSIGAGRKRGFDEIAGLDEESYARKYLATEGSVFFRRKDKAPRSFLWRVLDGRKLLEIQCVDLVHDTRSTRSESWLTFRVQLPTDIVRDGVVFADPEEADALEAFVLTTGNELYTITLKRDLLTRETAPSEFDAATCFKKYLPSSLGSNRRAYRLVAVSSRELLISLDHGGIMHLSKQQNENGAQWRETFFNEQSISGTIRGALTFKRQQTVPYGDKELYSSALAAMARSPDGRFIWAVSLDHTLKAWSTETGKFAAAKDILNVRLNDEQRKQQKYVMNPEQGTLMQVVVPPQSSKALAKMDEDEANDFYFLVLRSPKENEFKFYEVSSRLESNGEPRLSFEDLQLGQKLVPPIDELMDTSVWKLEEFHVLPGPMWRNTQLWIRARNGKLCKIFTITFDLLKDDGTGADLERQWQNGWTVVDHGMQTAEALQACTEYPGHMENISDNNAITPTEKWLDFLFYPARFSLASIETALQMYRKGRGLSAASGIKSLSVSEIPLQERLAQAVSSKIIVKRLPNDQPDHDKYQSQIQSEWKTFYSLLRDLHTCRHDSVGLALNPEDGLPWNVCADFVAPIRACSDFERLALNEHLIGGDELQHVDEEIANEIFPSDDHLYHGQVMAAAREFSASLSAGFREKVRHYVVLEAASHGRSDRADNERSVLRLYNVHNFSAEVMDDDFQVVEHAAQRFGGLGELSESSILGVLETMQQEGEASAPDAGKGLNRYGDKLAVAVAQETLERNRGVLLDLLVLVVFMYGDLEKTELHPEFVSEIGPIYDAIITRLKHNEMLSWLARNTIAEPQRPNRSSKPSQAVANEVVTVTLLERIFIGDWNPRSKMRSRLPELITLWCKQWTYGAELWQQWDGVTGHILAFLIKHQSYELATEFQQFLSQGEESSSWLRYLEGRLLLATGDYAHASLKFKAAADFMASTRKIAGTDTAHLLSPEEANYFGVGQSRFYQHVSRLFEQLKIFSYAADFAGYALDLLEGGDGDYSGRSLAEIDRRKAMTDSPADKRAGNVMEEIDILKDFEKRKEEIRIRLFTALVETGRFRQALRILSGIAERPIKTANLERLIKACIEKDAVQSLLEMPFKESDLAQEADAVLYGLAKKSLASGSGGILYHQILYAFRTQQLNFRGAAEILYEHVARLRNHQPNNAMPNPEDETLIHAYVLLINTLACCGEQEAWLLAEPIQGIHSPEKKRRLVTIADVRKEYGDELDRRSDVLQGRFPLVGGDEMDVF